MATVIIPTPLRKLTSGQDRTTAAGELTAESFLLLQHRLARRGEMALQHRQVFDRRSLLVNFQRGLGSE